MGSELDPQQAAGIEAILVKSLQVDNPLLMQEANTEFQRLRETCDALPLYMMSIYTNMWRKQYSDDIRLCAGASLSRLPLRSSLAAYRQSVEGLRLSLISMLVEENQNLFRIYPDVLLAAASSTLGGLKSWPQLPYTLNEKLQAGGSTSVVVARTIFAIIESPEHYTSVLQGPDTVWVPTLIAVLQGPTSPLTDPCVRAIGEFFRGCPPVIAVRINEVLQIIVKAAREAATKGLAEPTAGCLEALADACRDIPANAASIVFDALNIAVGVVQIGVDNQIDARLMIAALSLVSTIFSASFGENMKITLSNQLNTPAGRQMADLLIAAVRIPPAVSQSFAVDDASSWRQMDRECLAPRDDESRLFYGLPCIDDVRRTGLVAASDLAVLNNTWGMELIPRATQAARAQQDGLEAMLAIVVSVLQDITVSESQLMELHCAVTPLLSDAQSPDLRVTIVALISAIVPQLGEQWRASLVGTLLQCLGAQSRAVQRAALEALTHLVSFGTLQQLQPVLASVTAFLGQPTTGGAVMVAAAGLATNCCAAPEAAEQAPLLLSMAETHLSRQSVTDPRAASLFTLGAAALRHAPGSVTLASYALRLLDVFCRDVLAAPMDCVAWTVSTEAAVAALCCLGASVRTVPSIRESCCQAAEALSQLHIVLAADDTFVSALLVLGARLLIAQCPAIVPTLPSLLGVAHTFAISAPINMQDASWFLFTVAPALPPSLLEQTITQFATILVDRAADSQYSTGPDRAAAATALIALLREGWRVPELLPRVDEYMTMHGVLATACNAYAECADGYFMDDMDSLEEKSRLLVSLSEVAVAREQSISARGNQASRPGELVAVLNALATARDVPVLQPPYSTAVANAIREIKTRYMKPGAIEAIRNDNARAFILSI